MPAPIFLIAPTASDRAAAESVRGFLDRLRASQAAVGQDKTVLANGHEEVAR